MKRLLLLLLPLGLGVLTPARAQAPTRFLTTTGRVTFFSSSPIEDIEARNEKVAAVLDFGTGQIGRAHV